MVAKVVVMLNARTVETVQATTQVQYLIDDGGLYLKVAISGTKTWLYRSQASKRRHWVTIGRYPAMSLLEARNKALELRQLGLHAARSVQQAYEAYLPHLRRSYVSHAEIERRFQADILPRMQKRLTQVTRADCSDALQAIVARGSLVAANRTLPDVKNFFAWCVERGWIQDNPAEGITRKSVGGRERSRRRALSFLELPRVITRLRTMHHNTDLRTRLALGLVLVTGQRPSEVLGYEESERAGAWWTIPEERVRKSDRAQKVYLSPQARALLFLATRNFGSKPFRGLTHRTLDKAVSRFRYEPAFTPHDLRRTMSTRLADLGVAPHIVEKMLNHRMEGPLAVYNVAEYLPERRAAWRLWGQRLATLRRESARPSTDPAVNGVCVDVRRQSRLLER